MARNDFSLTHCYQWYPEIVHYLGGVPIILVATKADLRMNEQAVNLLGAQGRAPIERQQGMATARRMQAQYCEVSSLTGEGVDTVFELALAEAFRHKTGERTKTRNGKSRRCVII